MSSAGKTFTIFLHISLTWTYLGISIYLDDIASGLLQILVAQFVKKQGRQPKPEEVGQLLEEMTEERIMELMAQGAEGEEEEEEKEEETEEKKTETKTTTKSPVSSPTKKRKALASPVKSPSTKKSKEGTSFIK